MSEWSHLPNADHIDRILDSVKANPEAWYAAWDAARDAAWVAARDAARDAAWVAARIAAWDAARGAARDAARGAARNAAWNAAWIAAWIAARDAARVAAWDAARDAVSALIAWDDCAHLLDSEPDEVKILAKFGVPAAILLLPACIALQDVVKLM